MRADPRRKGRRGRPPIPWTWEHVQAARIALEDYWGLGNALSCWMPGSRRLCALEGHRLDYANARGAAQRAYAALKAGTGRLTYVQMDAIMDAFHHAAQPHAQERRRLNPYPMAEAAEILEAWLRDYDRRLPR